MGKRKKKLIGALLCEKGYIGQSQLEAALEEQKKTEDRLWGQILLELGYITETQLNETLTVQEGILTNN